MIYTIKWAEVTKTGEKNGREWKMTKMTLVGEDGVETSEVTTFDTVMSGGTIEGEIVQNGQYLNFQTKKADNKKPNLERVMEKKSASIAVAQENKARSIAEAQDRSAWMWAKTNASTLLGDSMRSANTDTIADRVIDLATKIYNGEPTTPF